MSEYQLMTEDQRDMVKLVKDFLMKGVSATRI